MLKHLTIPLFLLAGCAAPASDPSASSLPPLASEEQIAAAEGAPLSSDWGDWNANVEPFTIVGNIHYVGVKGVSAFLITTPDGHVLLDGGFAQSAPLIIANVERLGFEVGDVRYLLNSHAHVDHAAGLARLQRASGAQMVASEADRGALEAGSFPYGPSAGMRFPPIRVDRVIADGETLTLGGVTLTAHITAGHTPGCTSWSMDVAGADGAPHRAFFHCSATVAGQSLVPPAYPGIVADFRATFARVREIDADVLLTNHPDFMGLEERRARRRAGDATAFVDPNALSQLNERLERAFDEELARQAATRP
ncbi:MAG TPA: subclass B3 metallo-beta-lactamase [Vitreimonas sp.]|uniref:subclass B3 metallo-beta-lactamase n=1 Tax=Vitreimonas sp. TaxID=3069702 RepID=UPI002D5FC732|nr:subclass B3 metallo-beta-lactamase [Vitreimonas sp.]HYD87273.1 subclass B3 metallo-beta-lactamase [Vitreimonas sp.]